MNYKPLIVAAAIAATSGLAAAAPILSPVHQELGRAVSAVVAGNYRAAEPILRDVLQKDPTSFGALYNLAIVLKQTGRTDAAMAEYRDAYRAYKPGDLPARDDALYGLALAAEAGQRYAEANRAWNAYLREGRQHENERGAVAVAEARAAADARLAQIQAPTATQKANR